MVDVVEELLGGAPLTEENAASAGDAIAELDFEAARALLSELRAGVLAIHTSSSLRLVHRPIGLLGAGGGAGRRHMG